MSSNKKIEIGGDILEVQPLGSGSEVGRSCILIKYKGKCIMLDCGVHPAFSGVNSLPYFDEINPSQIDLVLITHFHLDHSGALPFLLEKTNFQGSVLMTRPTREVYVLSLRDFVKMAHQSLFSEADIENSLPKIEILDYHQEVERKGIKVVAYNAGHVLGAAMFLIDIFGVKILYTGDYSRELDRHLNPAEIPKSSVDILIVESTYGTNQTEEREKREKNFTRYIEKVVSRGGNCLLPVFAIGRCQELLLILDEFCDNSPTFKSKDIPIFYASSCSENSIDIFKKFINMTGEYVKSRFFGEGKSPFDFKHIKCVKEFDEKKFKKPVVVFASPGMLQNGLSKKLFGDWCKDEKNGLLITGYCVDGTLAKTAQKSKEIEIDGEKVQVKMSVENVTFCAHSDFKHTKEFIQMVKPKNIVLVHGESSQMERLKNEYDRLKENDDFFNKLKPKVFNPKNCQKIFFEFRMPKKGVILGELAKRVGRDINKKLNIDLIKENNLLLCDKNISNKSNLLEDNNNKMEIEEDNTNNINSINNKDKNIENIYDNYIEVSGLLFEEENFIVGEDDVERWGGLKRVEINNTLKVDFTYDKEILEKLLNSYFGNEIVIEGDDYIILQKIHLHKDKNFIIIKWCSDDYYDLLANSIAMSMSQIMNNPNQDILKYYDSI